MTNRVHPFLWWGIPVLLMISQILCEIFVPTEMKPAFFSEEGPHEKVQALIMLIAFVFAVRVFLTVEGVWLKLWFGIAALGSLYVGGEETSWGQTYLHWGTPESWMAINDQAETNLHNTSDWLDQKPKILLEIGVLVGGIIVPALARWKPHKLPSRFAAIYPTWQTSVAAGTALTLKIIDTVQDRVDGHLFWRISEAIEIFVYYFVLIYLIEMLRRFKSRAQE